MNGFPCAAEQNAAQIVSVGTQKSLFCYLIVCFDICMEIHVIDWLNMNQIIFILKFCCRDREILVSIYRWCQAPAWSFIGRETISINCSVLVLRAMKAVDGLGECVSTSHTHLTSIWGKFIVVAEWFWVSDLSSGGWVIRVWVEILVLVCEIEQPLLI